MASYNNVTLVGNLTRDVDTKTLDNGTLVGEFGLAINDSYINKSTGEKVDTPVFVDVTVWAKSAENCAKYIGKGSSVLVDGKLKLDMWETDGEKRQKLRIVATNVQFLGGKSDVDHSENIDQSLDTEDIPF
jgi:single-strand DNA-binding protein|tara:strand:+ start:620 stop:1012 length:393 start_codon:yes stop_codon:yes gene_type:complete